MHMKEKFNMQILKEKLYNSYAELFYRYTKLLSLSLIYEIILFLMIKLRLYITGSAPSGSVRLYCHS